MSTRPPLPELESDPVIEAYKRDVDRTLLRRNLALTPDQRLRQLMELQRFAEELRRAGRAARAQDDET
jgi:hypothetical protein